MIEDKFEPEGKTVDHYGFLVFDLEAARGHCEALLGVRFGEPESRDGVHLCRSLAGPPYLELTEAAAEGRFDRARGEGFHHLGLLDPAGGPERWHEAREALISVAGR